MDQDGTVAEFTPTTAGSYTLVKSENLSCVGLANISKLKLHGDPSVATATVKPSKILRQSRATARSHYHSLLDVAVGLITCIQAFRIAPSGSGNYSESKIHETCGFSSRA